jgi:DNA-binding beta-propeller fold protein YncE
VFQVSNGNVSIVAGNGTAGYSGDHGPANAAQLNGPAGLAVDTAGNLYIADSLNNVVRKVAHEPRTFPARCRQANFSAL